MSHDHPHDHPHPHTHDAPADDLPAPLDQAVPDSELAPTQLGRRRFLQRAGLLGGAAAAASVLGGARSAAADAALPRSAGAIGGPGTVGGYLWLSGDHHIHTQFSPDAQYRVIDQVQHANANGLDWMVITDHGSDQHARIGVEVVNPKITDARYRVPNTLVFQGLEWNIPAAEHGTVFVHPGPNEVSVLKQFEVDYDGAGPGATGTRSASSPENEALARRGLAFLADAVSSKRVRDAVMFANHPARKGIDSPHEIRGWRDAAPGIALGMEGAPGHQAAGIPAPVGAGSGRGYYDGSPSPASFPGYPLESYRTSGGFDWMTATVGGLWDSLISEGKPWWITANSDSHMIYGDTSVRGDSDFATNGYYGDPVYGGAPQLTNGDFWPGFYSRTHVGSADFSYASVMAGLRAGRVWVDHGRLVQSLDIRLKAGGKEVPLGGVLTAPRGSTVTLSMRIRPALLPNWSQFVPKLKKVDVIRGAVTGPAATADTFTAPGTRVVQSYDVSGAGKEFLLTYNLGRLDTGFYVRLRGSDGNRWRRRGRSLGRPVGPRAGRRRRRRPVEGPVVLHQSPVGPAGVTAGPAGTAVVGLDTGALTLREADADAHAVVRALGEAGALEGALVLTHLTTLGGAHVTLSVACPSPEVVAAALPWAQDTDAARAGAQAHAAGTSGRAVHFPGVELLVGTLRVSEVLVRTAVDAVHVLGGTGPADPSVPLVTRDHVRPSLDGRPAGPRGRVGGRRDAGPVRDAEPHALLRRPRLRAGGPTAGRRRPGCRPCGR